MTDPTPEQTPERPRALTADEEKARKRRNVAIFWSLIGFILLIFLVTIQRMASNISAGG